MPPLGSQRFPRVLAVALVCLAASILPAADPPAVRVWQTNHGLPDNMVSGLAQTADGFIWVASGFGLSRFDGAVFQEMPLDVRLAADAVPRIRLIANAPDGGLFFGTEQGALLHVAGGKVTVARGEVPTTRVETMLVDHEGTLWATYRAGALYRMRDGISERLTSEKHNFPDPAVPAGCTLGKDERGRVWIIKSDQLFLFRDGRFEPTHKVPIGTTRMSAARAGGLWICIERKLFRFRPETGLELKAELLESGLVRPYGVLEDSAGRVWIGTNSTGLFRWDGQELLPVAVAQREVLTLLEDAEANVWVGTNGGGLQRLQPRAMEVEGALIGLPFETVQSICESRTGDMFGVTHDGELVRRDSRGWRKVPSANTANRTEATVVAAHPDGSVWIGSRSFRLNKWNEGEVTSFGRAEGIASRNCRVLMISREGDVWMGAEGPAAVYRVRDGQVTAFPVVASEGVWALAQDASGVMWVGTRSGNLFRFDGDRLVDESARLGTKARPIRALHGSSDGALWIAFDGAGIARLKDDAVGWIGAGEGLVDDRILMIISDLRGWMWIGTRRGLFKVRHSELEAVASGHSRRIRSVHGEGLYPSGLPAAFGDPMNPLLGRDGRLWIPLTTALMVIRPDRWKDEVAPPDVIVTEFAVDGIPLAISTDPLPRRGIAPLASTVPLTIPPGRRRIEFRFAAPSFTAPDNVVFRYRLDGHDDRWIEADTRRSVAFPELPAGRYTFRVAARSSTGIWNETPASVAFSVSPFFWQTWWFQLIILVLFTLAVIGAVRYVSFRRLRSRVAALQAESALYQERARIARDIHDDLGSRLTKIVLLSGLVLRDRAAPQKASARVVEMAETARQLLASLNETVWSVNPRNDTLPHLVDYIGQHAVSFLRSAEIACQVDLPTVTPNHPVPADVRHNLFLTVKEALNNVVRHAQATEVTLKVGISAAEMTIVIDDNGRGFSGRVEDPEADGLRNMRERMETLGGGFSIAAGPVGGTSVMLHLPLPPRRASP